MLGRQPRCWRFDGAARKLCVALLLACVRTEGCVLFQTLLRGGRACMPVFMHRCTTHRNWQCSTCPTNPLIHTQLAPAHPQPHSFLPSHDPSLSLPKQALPAGMDAMVCLETLDVSYNHLRALAPSLGSCPTLRVVSLNGCPIARLPSEWGVVGPAPGAGQEAARSVYCRADVLPALVMITLGARLRDDPVVRGLKMRGVATVQAGYSLRCGGCDDGGSMTEDEGNEGGEGEGEEEIGDIDV